jgi:DNA-binding FadR family transcriptional regulator
MVPPTLETRLMREFRLRQLVPGDAIPSEQVLAQELNVGRPALREGLRALETLGIVRGRQGARRVLHSFDLAPLVRHLTTSLAPTPESVHELLEVRRVLEVSFFPHVMSLFTREDIARLRFLADKMTEKAARGEVFLKEDADFHAALFARIHNRVLTGLLEAFWELFEETSSETTTGSDLPATARSHAQIVDAIESGDAALAAHQLNSHFFDVRARLVDQARQTH